MTSVDKAAIGWSIAIVAIGIGVAMAGLSADSGVSQSTGAVLIKRYRQQKNKSRRNK